MIKKFFKNMDNKYWYLQLPALITGIIASTVINFTYNNKKLYLYCLITFMLYNLIQIIHFTKRRMYIETILFIYYIIANILGISFMFLNK